MDNPVYVLCDAADGLVAVGPFADSEAVTAWENEHGTFGHDVVIIQSPTAYLNRPTAWPVLSVDVSPGNATAGQGE